MNANDTILGADNKATIAGMLDGVRRVLADGLPHAGIEIVLTPQEEVGLQGAKQFDHTLLQSRVGFVYDHAGPLGGIVMAAPGQNTISLEFRGQAAHAGIAPEEGRSAIVAAAQRHRDVPAGPYRRRDDRQRRHRPRRRRAQRRPGRLHHRGRGAQPRHGPPGRGDRVPARGGRHGRRRRGLQPGDVGARGVRRLPVPARRPGRAAGAPGARGGRHHGARRGGRRRRRRAHLQRPRHSSAWC